MSKNKYIEFESDNDVLKQDVSDKTRDYARESLLQAYLAASNADKQNAPKALTKNAEQLEKLLYDRFNKEPRDYLMHITRFKHFMNPDSLVGQFAKLFRIKVLQNVYTPVRIIDLDIPDILPEVFLSSKATPSDKLFIHQTINNTLSDELTELRYQYNQYLDPSMTITKAKIVEVPDTVTDLISDAQVDVREICENPNWKMKMVNIIICKENGKFYCLDTEKLLQELAEKNTATNYFTDKPLTQEIQNNLRERYTKEIEEMKDKKTVTIGDYTTDDLENFKTTIEKLRKFRDIFNLEEVQEQIELFGLDEIENPEYGGVEGLLQNIPPMIQEEYYTISTTDGTDSKEWLNDWIDDNIKEIIEVIEANYPEEKIPKLKKKELEPKVKSPEVNSPTLSDEQKFIKQTVLGKKTVSYKVYNDALDRLSTMRESIIELLKSVNSIEKRQELNTTLADVNAQLKELRGMGSTINGLLTLLKSKLQQEQNRYDAIKNNEGMNMIYANTLIAQKEKENLESSIKNIQTEIAYLLELEKSF